MTILLTALLVMIFSFIAALVISIIRPRLLVKSVLPALGLTFVLAVIASYFVLPAWTMLSLAGPNLVALLVFSAIFYTLARASGEGVPDKSINISALGGAVILLFLLVLLVRSLFGYEETHEAIDNNSEVADNPPSFSEEETPVQVAPESARNKMQKAMSEVDNAQFYDFGDIQAQVIDGEPMYVANVDYTNLFRWFRGDGTPGYFQISAVDPNDNPTFVESSMQYTNSSFFNEKLNRVIYSAFPSWYQSGSTYLEVDEEGKPWYVQTVYQNRALTWHTDHTNAQVVVVDPETGEASKYKADNAPSFIESTYSPAMASDMNDKYGKYGQGLLNYMFGKEDVLIPNENGTENKVTPVFDADGNMSYFTDFTSPNEDSDSTLGVSFIDARTGELRLYNGEEYTGAMDTQGARGIVNRQFPEKEWTGSMPIMYNINGNATWVVNTLDPSGLFRQYAYIKANDADVYAFGETAQGALENYRSALASTDEGVEASEADREEAQGTVDRVVITSGAEDASLVQFKLEGDDTLYVYNTSSDADAVLMKEGDEVTFTVNRSEDMGTVQEITDQPW